MRTSQSDENEMHTLLSVIILHDMVSTKKTMFYERSIKLIYKRKYCSFGAMSCHLREVIDWSNCLLHCWLWKAHGHLQEGKLCQLDLLVGKTLAIGITGSDIMVFQEVTTWASSCFFLTFKFESN